MRRLGLLAWMGLCGCSVLGPDADNPVLLTISGVVREETGPVEERLDVVLTWYVNARPNEPVLVRAERTRTTANGRFTLDVRSLPPPETRLRPINDATDAAPIAFGFLDVRTPSMEDSDIAGEGANVALVFPGQAPFGAELGWNQFLSEDLAFQRLEGTWSDAEIIRFPSDPPALVPCTLLSESFTSAEVSRAEAESTYQDAESTWCDDEDVSVGAFSSCVNFDDYLCRPMCSIDFRTLEAGQPYPQWWPCNLLGEHCDPDAPVTTSCQYDIGGPAVECDPSAEVWVEQPPCPEPD